MTTAKMNPNELYCVGKTEEYTSLLKDCGSINLQYNLRYVYYGEKISEPNQGIENIMILSIDIYNIAFCIKNAVERIFLS